ncbi:MAG: hypothetical protein JSS04_17030 [Proteobacteria bacterium]|nr:hypothetical protein [Pseudomonadota bacterium]
MTRYIVNRRTFLFPSTTPQPDGQFPVLERGQQRSENRFSRSVAQAIMTWRTSEVAWRVPRVTDCGYRIQVDNKCLRGAGTRQGPVEMSCVWQLAHNVRRAH